MAEHIACNLCGCPLAPHAHYIVRIDVFADPSLPPMHTADLDAIDFDKTFDHLTEQLKHLSADEAQDQVHRRFDYTLCGGCHRQYLANPLGLPRQQRPGHN